MARLRSCAADNLGGLLDSVVECRLEKVWELPDDYRPPATLKRPCVNKIEVRDSGDDAMLESSRASRRNEQR